MYYCIFTAHTLIACIFQGTFATWRGFMEPERSVAGVQQLWYDRLPKARPQTNHRSALVYSAHS